MINKIDKKYCVGNRVQVMFPDTENQIIFNKDGVLFLKSFYRNGRIIFDKYLTEQDKEAFPYGEAINFENYNCHIFDCDKVYVRMADKPSEYNITVPYSGYHLSFLLFKKMKDGNVIGEEQPLSIFKSEKTEITTDAFGVKSYFDRQNDEFSKYIFCELSGLEYVNSKDLGVNINRFNLDLDNESIVEQYNQQSRPLPCFSIDSLYKMEGNQLREKVSDNSWMKTNISEVKEFSLIDFGIIGEVDQYLVTVKDDQINISKFDIVFISENVFKIKEQKYYVSPDCFDIGKGKIPAYSEPATRFTTIYEGHARQKSGMLSRIKGMTRRKW